MKITLKVTKPSSLDVDCLGFLLWEEDKEKGIRDMPNDLKQLIREAFKKEDFDARKNEKIILSGKGLISAYKLILIGTGKLKELDNNILSEQIARLVRISGENKAVKIGIVISEEILAKLGIKKAVQITTESVYLSSYRFLKYKSEDEKKKIRLVEEVQLAISAGKIALAEEAVKSGEIVSRASLYARDLVNEPPQITTPSFLAEEALKIAKNSKGLVKVTILEKEEIQKMKMNSFLGVAKGSDEQSKFILMRYKSSRPGQKIVLIGKSITFDTGGLSLKPASAMETMKLDMAGGAAILGVFSVLEQVRPRLDVVGILPACENMPSGKALRPGDILTAMNGKTIEIINTDAEGRLTLADALSYAVIKEKPDEIIDLATLTGACMVALGQDIAGLFGNNEKFLSMLEMAARETGEKVWRMPLDANYKELNKSKIADIKNAGSGKYAGAITAALFLQEFAGIVPWAHLDIAGPAFMEKDTPLIPYGGTGFGVRLILHYLCSV